MYCWSCGAERRSGQGDCSRCGAGPVPLDLGLDLPSGTGGGRPAVPPGGSDGPWHEREWHHWSERSRVRVCGGCGYRGEGIGYFRRTAHVVLLVGAGILTYGVGALVYWLIKRGDEVCPRCGISWRRSRSLGAELPPAGGSSRGAGGGSHGWLPSGAARHRGPGRVSGGRRETALPSAGGFRGVMGVLLALMALLLLGVGISTAEGMAVVLSLVSGAAGAVSFGSSVKARQGRRAAVLRRAQAQVLELAREQGGVLTATEVASRLDLSLEGAERILLSLDDGFRIRSEVTKEGLLVFEFPEILWRRRGGALERDPEGPGGPDHLGDRIGGSGRLGGSGQDS